MEAWSEIKTWESALNYLDDYSQTRKSELNERQLSKDASLAKSYMLETQLNGISARSGIRRIQGLLRTTGWTLVPLDRDDVYRVIKSGDFMGFLEVVSERYFVFHTLRKTQEIDRSLRNAITDSAKLDNVWLAGSYLNLLWELLIRQQMPERFVSFKFEHQGKFEDTLLSAENDDYDDEMENGETNVPLERRSSTLSVTSNVRKIARFLPELQAVLADFKAIKMLRMPAAETRGGYDFWDWGKVTYRAPKFREGRELLFDVLDYYARATQEIERRVWFELEKTKINDSANYVTIRGTPVTFVFPIPLEETTFINFIETTFIRGQGPFRLWGEPIHFGSKKVHVYGVDMHLWQKIYLELTPKRFIVILPTGTCGNTVHRLVSNIQRFISPDVKTYVGDYEYSALMQDVILGANGIYQ